MVYWSRYWVSFGAASALLLGQNATAQQRSSAATAKGDRLKLVQIIVSPIILFSNSEALAVWHGARTPLTDSYWEGATWDKGTDCGEAFQALKLSIKDLNGGPQPPPNHDAKQAISVLPGGCTKGELTRPGQLQSRDLGQWLRQRYVQKMAFLSPEYQESEVEARSTNYRRTIATLQGLLTGLWPGTVAAVPLRVAQDVDEVMFGRTDSCERLRDLMKAQARALKDSANTNAEVRDLEARARRAMGLPEDHRVHFTDLHDALTSMRFHGKQIPQGVSEELLRDIDREATRRMTALVAPQASEAHGPATLRLSMGPLFEEARRRMAPPCCQLSMGPIFEKIVQKMDAVAQGASAAPLHIYCGHDTTIMPILATLGIKLRDWPPYLSHVIFELWEKPSAEDGTPCHFVKCIYNHEELPLAHHSNGEPVLLEEFKEVYLKPYIVTNDQYREECKVSFDHSTPAPGGEFMGGSAVQGL